MSRDLAGMTPRTSRQSRLTDRRPGIIPERRDTRAPALEGFARMGTASRGDNGAGELMRTLGMVREAAGDFKEYADRRFDREEEVNAGRGAADQAIGHVDPELAEQSNAYRRAVELGREQTEFPGAVLEFDDQLRGVVEQQTSADRFERRSEADASINDFLTQYAADPETGEIRDGLTTPEAKRWLAGTMIDTRQRLTAAAYARIDERMNGEGLANAGKLLATQLDTGAVDIAALRKVLPPTVTDEALRGTILATVMGKSADLKASGRYADSVRILDQLLGNTPAVAASPTGITTGAAAPAVPTVVESTGRRRSKDEVIGFVLNTLEGGPVVVDNGDGGGTTKFGITARHNPGVDVANLTFGQASRIARERYWQDAYSDAHPAVAAIAFDAGFLNSKSFGRELATKYANDPVGALEAYRQRLQEIAKKPDKTRFLSPWMNRVDRLGVYLGVGPGGSRSDNVIDDPSFALDPEPLDPVEDARRNPWASFAPLLTGGLAIPAEERTRIIEYREQLSREVRQEWKREQRERQDDAHAGFMLRLSGLGEATTPSEIREATRVGAIRPEDAVSLLNVIRADADRDEQRAEQAANAADRARDREEEQQAQGLTARLMGPVYSGTRSPAEALRLFSDQAAGINPRVRRAVLAAVTSEANGIEEVRKNNPAFTEAADELDDGEAEMLRLVRANYRSPQGGIITMEQQRAQITLEVAKAKRRLARAAIDTGNIGNLRKELVDGIKRKVRPYLVKPAAQRR